ncbi:MAG: hypothetical protein M0016_00370 [Deltaproteobacteria bacterium]|jgi:hypothetical protein|nr:hypothetical protein [Deltaproteobacteria bacterium]MCL5880348.1 hypothetical protein [Deltaproteobacteria bacterium]MDA8303613.1 hypothetical protein [Deltaproteobacteria bacterium]
MMKIKIDGKDVDLSVRGNKPDSLYDFISNDIVNFIPKGRVIKDIYLNGTKFDELLIDDGKAKALRLTEDGELGIITMSSNDLILESISAINNYFNDLSKNLSKVSDLLRVGNDKDGFNDFAADLKGITAFVQIMDKLAPFLNIDYSTYTYKEKTIKAYFDDLETVLSKILETQRSHDYTMLADIIEFEMEPLLKVWQDVLESFKSRI